MRPHLLAAIETLTRRFGAGSTARWDVQFATSTPAAVTDAAVICTARDTRFPSLDRFRELVAESERALAAPSPRTPPSETCAGRSAGCEYGWIHRRVFSQGRWTWEVVACRTHNPGPAAVADEDAARRRREAAIPAASLARARQITGRA